MTRPCDCRHEYGEAELTLELVSSMDEAIDHLHAHGSGHTECIITGECQGLHPETHHAHAAYLFVFHTANAHAAYKHLPHAHAVACMLSFVRCSVSVTQDQVLMCGGGFSLIGTLVIDAWIQ